MSSPSPTTSRSSGEEIKVEEVTTTPPKISKEESLNPLSNFLEVFFNTAFCLCLCPFRIKRTKDEKASKPFVIATFWPQRVLCAILTLLSLFWFIREIRISVPIIKTPAGYVQLVLALVTTFVKLVIISNLWFNREPFLDIVNFVAESKTKFKWTGKLRLLVVPVAYTIMGLVLFLTIRGEDVNGGIIHDWTWNRWIHSLTYAGRYNFFVSEIPFPRLCNNTVRIILDGQVSNYVRSVDTLLLVLTVLGSFTRNMIGPFSDFLMLMSTLTLWTETKIYCRKVKAGSKSQSKEIVKEESEGADEIPVDKNKQGNGDANGDANAETVSIEISPPSNKSDEWQEIYEGYKYLKKLADLINQTLGLYVTGSIVEDVLYYAVFFDLVFAEGDLNWGRILGLLFFFASTCTILVLWADLSQRMSALKSWLNVEENRKNVPIDMIMLLINHVDTKQMAIKGSKIFPVTWKTLCTMLGVTATYFILCVKDKTLVIQKLKCGG